MAIPNGGGGFQIGAGNPAETLMSRAAAPQTATATATLSAAQVVGGWLVANPGASAATYTLPTAALIDAALPNASVGNTFDLYLINTGITAGAVTLATATGLTDGGNAFVA